MSEGLGRKGETILECPFCQKGKVRVFHKGGYLQPKVSRISAGAKVKYYRMPDTYQVLEDCPECGKSMKEIQKAFETGETEQISHDERLKRIKEAGLPTRVDF
jgi:endogenous inhibitor of DNA gyrase (YacG/DUF329 family)